MAGGPGGGASILNMAALDQRNNPITERYPGEQLALLRKVSADLDYLRGVLAPFLPMLSAWQNGGLLSARRAAQRGRNLP